jgi:hypothetical protein
MARAPKDPAKLKAEKEELKKFEVKTGVGLLDGMVNKVDVNNDGLSDAAQINRAFQKYSPQGDRLMELFKLAAPYLSREGTEKFILDSPMIKPGMKDEARSVIQQILEVAKETVALASEGAEVASQVAEVVKTVKAVTK